MSSPRDPAHFRRVLGHHATGVSIVTSVLRAGVVAWIDCSLHAQHEAGGHLIVLGEVRVLDVKQTVAPLVVLRGGYGRLATTS